MDKFYIESLESMERTAPDFRKMQFVKVCTDDIMAENYAIRSR